MEENGAPLAAPHDDEADAEVVVEVDGGAGG